MFGFISTKEHEKIVSEMEEEYNELQAEYQTLEKQKDVVDSSLSLINKAYEQLEEKYEQLALAAFQWQEILRIIEPLQKEGETAVDCLKRLVPQTFENEKPINAEIKELQEYLAKLQGERLTMQASAAVGTQGMRNRKRALVSLDNRIEATEAALRSAMRQSKLTPEERANLQKSLLDVKDE